MSVLVETERPGHDHHHRPPRAPQRRRSGHRRGAARRLRRLRGGRRGPCRGPDRRRRPFLRRLRPQGLRRGGRRLRPARRRPDGPDPPAARQAGARRGRGLCRGRRHGARFVVRPAYRLRNRDLRHFLPALGRAADRRRHGPAAADRRPGPGARPDPHRPARSAPRRRWRSASPTASCRRARRAPRPSDWPPRSPAFRPCACAPTATSAYAGWDGELRHALQAEAIAGAAPLREGARAGAARFAGGLGRGGGFKEI